MTMWRDAPTFVGLALAIQEHMPGFVDAYFGPDDLAAQARQAGKVDPPELLRRAEALLLSIQTDTELPAARRESLAGETLAMHTLLRILAGETLTLSDEAQGLYGVRAEWVDEGVFDEIRREIEDALPGSGRLADRLDAFFASTELTAEIAISVIQDISDYLRLATRTLVELPEDESCELAIVQDKPWRAYNWFLGHARSRIEFSQDVPIRFPLIPRLAAHEAYPGHHTEHTVKEALLYRQAGQLEFCFLPANGPSTVVSEGIADAAYDAITQPEERLEILRQARDRHSLQMPELSVMETITGARWRLSGVLSNATILLYDGGATDSEITSYQQRYGLCNEKEAECGLASLRDPLWRSYAFAYTAGDELVRGAIAASPAPRDTLAKLLREPIHPAHLRRMAQTPTNA